MRATFSFHEIGQYAFFLGRFSLRIFLLGSEYDTPTRFEDLLSGYLEFHLIHLTQDRSGRYLAIRIKGGDKTTGYQIVHLPFRIRKIAGGDSGRDDRMVIGNLRVIKHFLALRQFLIHQRSGKLRIIHQPFQGIGNFRIDIITKESRVHTRVGCHLLLVERLDQLKRIVCRKSEFLVTFHLQRGQVE